MAQQLKNPKDPGPILVIEDDPHLRARIRNILEGSGYSVFEAPDGKIGVETLQSMPLPQVILLDMVMPVMSGWDFLDFQRSAETFKKIPVVAISAFHDLARSAQPNHFLPKPVEPQSLLTAIESFRA